MSKPKILDISIDELKEIAKALNQNTIENRSRINEDKIQTDKFIRRFNILRKDFSETIKGTCISYNKRTFLYDIKDEEELSNNELTKSNNIYKITNKKESNTKVTNSNYSSENHSNKKVTLGNNEKNSNILKILKEEIPELFEMLEWYKCNTKVIEENKININNEKLNGELLVRSFKTYKNILDEFGDFCKKRSATQKDLLAIALIEFMDKYK